MRVPDHQRLTRSFFRGVNSPALLRRFFEGFGVWGSMGLDDDAGADAIFKAWEDLASANRSDILEALCRINDLGREKARFALRDRWRQRGLPENEKLTLEKQAITLFLEHRAAFDALYLVHTFEKAENLQTLIGRRPVACAPSRTNVENFRLALSKALSGEAHGSQLLVEEEGNHPEKWMAGIPHQTYAKPDHEFAKNEEGKIVTRDRNPVQEMVLIYYPEKGVLKLKAGRGRTKVERVAECFATEILGQSPDFFEIRNVVNFQPLLEPHFAFTPGPTDHFQSVRATRIEFSRHANPGVDYMVHCKDQYDGAPSALDQLVADGIGLSEIDVHSMSLCFRFSAKFRDTRTVELRFPNGGSLDETERDRYIESVLVREGIINHAAKEILASVGAH